jgi:hypothetical protein
MRTTLEIIIAVTECQPVTEDELKLALMAMSSIEHFLKQELLGLIEAIREGKPTVKMRAEAAWGTVERMWNAAKKPPDEWLGPTNIPGNAEHSARLKRGKALFKKATGIDLD